MRGSMQRAETEKNEENATEPWVIVDAGNHGAHFIKIWPRAADQLQNVLEIRHRLEHRV
jgi:hypothetical protein